MERIAVDYGCSKSSVHRSIVWVENTLSAEVRQSNQDLLSRRVFMIGRQFEGITLSASGDIHEKTLLYSLENEVYKHFKEFNQIITDTGVFAVIGERQFAYVLLDPNGTHIRIGALDAPQQIQSHYFRDTEDTRYFFTPYTLAGKKDTLVISRKFL